MLFYNNTVATKAEEGERTLSHMSCKLTPLSRLNGLVYETEPKIVNMNT